MAVTETIVMVAASLGRIPPVGTGPPLAWEAARDRSPRPARKEIIKVPTISSYRSAFKSDSPQHPDVASKRTETGPGSYDVYESEWLKDKFNKSSQFASKSRAGGYHEQDWAGQSPRTTSRGGNLLSERPLTADLEFITEPAKMLFMTQPAMPNVHGLTWASAVERPPPPRAPGEEVLSDALYRPEGSLLAAVGASPLNYTASFNSSQQRLAPPRKLERGQLSTYDALVGTMRVHDPKRASSTFKSAGRTRPPGLQASTSTPSFGGGRSTKVSQRQREPYGGGDWVVPRAPPLPPKRKVAKPPSASASAVSLSTSASAASLVPGDTSWTVPKGKKSSFGTRGGRPGERFEVLPEGFGSQPLPTLCVTW